MKKVYEDTVSTTQAETFEDHGSYLDHIVDPFDDGDDPLNFKPENYVPLEKGQEAILKVTVTTTVELIDVRMAEPDPRDVIDGPYPVQTERADGCGFFYGNPCGCGFTPGVDAPKHIEPLVKAPRFWLCQFCAAEQPAITGREVGTYLTLHCGECKTARAQRLIEKPIPIALPDTERLVHWHKPAACGTSRFIGMTGDGYCASDPALVDCPDCLKVLASPVVHARVSWASTETHCGTTDSLGHLTGAWATTTCPDCLKKRKW